ncbi:hypothetical protein ACRRTK_009119 [Alexandromys fortis]
MDENVAEFLRRSILKIPLHAIKTILKTWDFLSENQLETINLRQRKESLAQEIILLCEGKNATLDDMALLDIVYTQVHRHKKLWDVFEMSKEPGEDVDLFDMKQFQASFKKILQRALKNVSVNFRVDQKNAVWIRVAWGTQHSQPNQYKPTFVVYYPQTPYAFISTCPLKSTVPLLHQALKVASKHHQIVHLNLKSRLLDSLKAIVFREYNQNFDSHNTTVPLQEGSFGLDVNLDSNIILENTEEKERIQRVTQETFGTYPQPQLEFAQYKLLPELGKKNGWVHGTHPVHLFSQQLAPLKDEPLIRSRCGRLGALQRSPGRMLMSSAAPPPAGSGCGGGGH